MIKKLSWLKEQDLKGLSDAVMTEVVFGEKPNENANADVALLLGGEPLEMEKRVYAAAKLYFEGRVSRIIATGGVTHEDGESLVTEAAYMSRRLIAHGVPQEAIFEENEARTTVENMLCSLLTMEREMDLTAIHSVIIVTSYYHLFRSVALAKWLLPKCFSVSGYAVKTDKDCPEGWTTSETMRENIFGEIYVLRWLTERKAIGNIEYHDV